MYGSRIRYRNRKFTTDKNKMAENNFHEKCPIINTSSPSSPSASVSASNRIDNSIADVKNSEVLPSSSWQLRLLQVFFFLLVDGKVYINIKNIFLKNETCMFWYILLTINLCYDDNNVVCHK